MPLQTGHKSAAVTFKPPDRQHTQRIKLSIGCLLHNTAEVVFWLSRVKSTAWQPLSDSGTLSLTEAADRQPVSASNTEAVTEHCKAWCHLLPPGATEPFLRFFRQAKALPLASWLGPTGPLGTTSSSLEYWKYCHKRLGLVQSHRLTQCTAEPHRILGS